MLAKVTVLGNLGNEPELRFTKEGQEVCNFSVAANRRWTNQATGEKVTETTWFRVSAWGPQAKACAEYLHKGSPVYIEGRLRPDASGNPAIFQRRDGSVGASYEIQARDVRFVAPASNGITEDGEVIEEDDAPF